MPMPRALLFDLMGTVLRDPYREALLAGTGRQLDELRERMDPDAWPAFEVAAIDEAEFLRRCFGPATGLVFDPAAFSAARRAGYAWMPGMRRLLDDLSGHVDRYVASNYPVWITELAEVFALDRMFEGVFASHHLGVRKPEPAFFVRLLEAVGLPAGACLFIDDRADNCASAAAVGLQVHRFTDADALRDRLRAEGLPV